jgi:ribonucleoside-diphosphate reductase beta chain
MKTTATRKVYKPISFPWAIESCEAQHKMHWMPYEIDLMADLNEFYNEISDSERKILIQILRFFTQVDVEVARCYVDYYLKIFQCPEIRMMLLSFASMETIHVLAYSFLITSLRLPDSEYSAFLEYEEMVAKYNYMQSFNVNDPQGIALTLALVSGFIEGLVLFSSFAILLYFSLLRGNYKKSCLKGLGQIISFSIRDETLHCLSIIKLYHTFVKENEDKIDKKKLHDDIYTNCKILIEQEMRFIDLAFQAGELEHLKTYDLKEYIKYLADIRLKQLGLAPLFNITVNPLTWMDSILFPREIANFFEVTPTGYTKGHFLEENIDEDFWNDYK